MEVIKIISIGEGGDRLEVGGICYIEIKEDWGYNRALGNTCMDNSGFGITTIVGACSRPSCHVSNRTATWLCCGECWRRRFWR